MARRRGRQRRQREKQDSLQERIIAAVMGVALAVAFLYALVLKPAADWAVRNPAPAIAIGALILIIIIGGSFLAVKELRARRARRRTELATLPAQLRESIEAFTPSRWYAFELPYQAELQGWLKQKFPASKIEIQTGASRPDIVVDNVAIEIKGPTDDRALDTLTTKCLKYLQHYEFLLIVLFDPRYSETNFREISNGITRQFPNVRIVVKSEQAARNPLAAIVPR